MSVVDAHLHIWQIESGEYFWLNPRLGPLYRSFTLEDSAPARERCGVSRVVLVQAADTPGDTARMLSVAAAHPEVAGVVCWVPLDSPAVRDAIHERLESGQMVGVRALFHEMRDPEWLLRANVAGGLSALAEAGLPLDFVTSDPEALAIIPELTARHPSLRVIIDHLGKPVLGGGSAEISEWAELLKSAATSANVAAKLSGFRGFSSPGRWSDDDLRPIVSEALETFGADRLMYGSDWPVSVLGNGYVDTFRALERTLVHLGASQQEVSQVFGRTAEAWYQLREGAQE